MIHSIEEIKLMGNKFRMDILETIYSIGKGHIGGSYSCIDILSVLYYGNLLNINKENFSNDDRNRFLMSKGHCAIAQYVILCDLGMIKKSDLDRMNDGGILGEHPDHNIPGIEFDTGSLGHGLSVGAGFAFSDKLDKKDNKTYVLLGDGECYEGSVWEAAQLSSHLQLDNLIAIVDRNRLCTHGNTEKINAIEPFSKKWESFGWNVVEVDGHDHGEMLDVFSNIESKNPTVVIANTIKGKGVSFMENNPIWHHGAVGEREYKLAYDELNKRV